MFINYTAYFINNKILNKKYIGITSRDPKIRFMEHYSSQQTLVGKDMNIFGKRNFELLILEENISEKDKDYKERYYISLYDCLYPNGYNKSTGGIKGKDLNEISKKQLSESSIGINNSRCNQYIEQYDLEGNLLNIFGSAREAARFLGNESKYRSILYCLNRKNKKYDNYIWKYKEK